MKTQLIFVKWLVAVAFLVAQAPVSAAPTQDEVFKSISDNMGNSHDPGMGDKTIKGVLVGAVGLVVLLTFVGMRQRKPRSAKTLNHAGKLTKELLKKIPLRKAELKAIRTLAEVKVDDARVVENPLVLMLCPSVLSRCAGKKGLKIDKRVVESLIRKLALK